MRRLAPALGFMLLTMAGCSRADTPRPPEQTLAADHAWVELTDRGAEARLITSTAACPAAEIDGKPAPMNQRAGPSAEFPLTVCELLLPQTARQASVRGIALPLAIETPKRIVMFGDTGCRLQGDDIQNCDNPQDWPFAVVARLAAAPHPHLVIHVGDYYYRESPCPAGRAGCAGSPWGDNWNSWNADFFQPAEPLLRAAPWIMARGNHEDCERGGPGWFLLLDGAATARTCPAQSAPMAISVGGLAFYVLDSSGTDDRNAPAAAVAAFSAQLDALKTAPPTGSAWIITHRPIWGLVPVVNAGPLGPIEVAINATEQAAARGRDLKSVAMVVSGHIHHFASFSFAGERPPQLIVGTGGDVGEPADTPRFLSDSVHLDGMSAKRFGFDRYGFLVLEKTGDGWAGAFYDVRDRAIATCKLVGRALTCQAAK
jgi:hypothetical protein